LNFNFESKKFHKRFAEDAIPIAEKLKINDSADIRIQYFLNFLLSKFLRAVDISIILKNNEFAVNLNNLAIFDNLKRKQKLYRNFNEKIPILLFNSEKRGRDEDNEDNINKIINS
jgi:hypothetical protein